MSIIPRSVRIGDFILFHYRVKHCVDRTQQVSIDATARGPGGMIALPRVEATVAPHGRANAYLALRIDPRFVPGVYHLDIRCSYGSQSLSSLDAASDRFEVLAGDEDAVSCWFAFGPESPPERMLAAYIGVLQRADLAQILGPQAGPCAPPEAACVRDAQRVHEQLFRARHGPHPRALEPLSLETPTARQLLAGATEVSELALAAYRLLDLPQFLRALHGQALRSLQAAPAGRNS